MIDWTDCPVVEVVPGKVSGVPILKGSRMPADGILENHESGMTAEEIAEMFELPLEPVRELLAWVDRHWPVVE